VSIDFDARRWRHLLYRYAGPGSAFEIYVDGALAATAPAEDPSFDLFDDAVTDLFIGYDTEWPGGANSQIEIDELRVYDVVLGEADQCTRIIGGSWTAAGGCSVESN
jgi:hypothetical protein